MMDNDRSVPGCLMILCAFAFVAFASIALGCGSTPQDNARRTVAVAAEAVDLTDQVFAQEYTLRARAALDASTDIAAYRATMAPLDAVVTALHTARQALEIADAVVRIWDQGGVSSWPQALACVVGGLAGVRNVLVAAGVELPPELTAALDLVRSLVDTDSCFTDAAVAVDAGTDGGV